MCIVYNENLTSRRVEFSFISNPSSLNMVYRSWVENPEDQKLRVYQTYDDGLWKMFADTRKKHNDGLCIETNKLVLRLDKLLSGNQKDDLDKSIVEWTPDDLVKLCPYCAKTFNFARRRHHCRACGAILCNSCSKFLEYRAARKLVKPAKLYTDRFDRIEDRLEDIDAETRPSIRTCEDCKRLLDKRIQTIEDHYSQPVFYELYEQLRCYMKEGDSLTKDQKNLGLELKTKIQELRVKFAKMAERESGKQAYLLRSIDQSVVCWLKERKL